MPPIQQYVEGAYFERMHCAFAGRPSSHISLALKAHMHQSLAVTLRIAPGLLLMLVCRMFGLDSQQGPVELSSAHSLI